MTHGDFERERGRDTGSGRRPAARGGPASGAPQMLRLQTTAGNRAVHRLLGARRLQRVTSGPTLAADKARARAVVDPLLRRFFIGQDAGSIEAERDKRKDQRIRELVKGLDPLDPEFVDRYEQAKATAQKEYEAEEPDYGPLKAAYREGDQISRILDIQAATGKFGDEPLRRLDYWSAKAERVRSGQRTELGGRLALWCDHATALVVDLLARDPGFISSLDVLKQGDPHVSGHWYVLANREKAPAPGRGLEQNEFIIDLWGAVRLGLPTAVHDAASAHLAGGTMRLFAIDKLTSVMSVPEKTERQGEDLLDDLLGELEEDKRARRASPAAASSSSGHT